MASPGAPVLSPEVVLTQARAFRAGGQPLQALELLDAALPRLDPAAPSGRLWSLRGRCLLALDRTDEAFQDAEWVNRPGAATRITRAAILP